VPRRTAALQIPDFAGLSVLIETATRKIDEGKARKRAPAKRAKDPITLSALCNAPDLLFRDYFSCRQKMADLILRMRYIHFDDCPFPSSAGADAHPRWRSGRRATTLQPS